MAALREIRAGGQAAKAQRLLPPERPYQLPAGTARRLDLG